MSEYDLNIDSHWKEGVSSLESVEGSIYVGREDGVFECIHGTSKYRYSVFAPDFDLLENVPIKEKITSFARISDGGVGDLLFLANEKSIKAVRIRRDASTLSVCGNNVQTEGIRVTEKAKCTAVHNYILNSISCNISNDRLISGDLLCINMWHPEYLDKYVPLVNLKPLVSTSGLAYVINSAKFSPYDDNIVACCASNGEIFTYDTNIAPNAARVSVMANKALETLKSVSDISFVDSNLVVSRTLNTVSLFDRRNCASPVITVDLVTEKAELALVQAPSGAYQTFKICSNGTYAYSGSSFGSVYCIDLRSSTVSEVRLADKREYNMEARVRCVTPYGAGFACAFMNKVYAYSEIK